MHNNDKSYERNKRRTRILNINSKIIFTKLKSNSDRFKNNRTTRTKPENKVFYEYRWSLFLSFHGKVKGKVRNDSINLMGIENYIERKG